MLLCWLSSNDKQKLGKRLGHIRILAKNVQDMLMDEVLHWPNYRGIPPGHSSPASSSFGASFETSFEGGTMVCRAARAGDMEPCRTFDPRKASSRLFCSCSPRIFGFPPGDSRPEDLCWRAASRVFAHKTCTEATGFSDQESPSVKESRTASHCKGLNHHNTACSKSGPNAPRRLLTALRTRG